MLTGGDFSDLGEKASAHCRRRAEAERVGKNNVRTFRDRGSDSGGGGVLLEESDPRAGGS